MRQLNNILVEFGSLFNNLDYLLVKKFIELNRDSVDNNRISLFSQDIALSRHDPNPLKFITQNEYTEDDKLESIYNDLYDNNIKSILEDESLELNSNVLKFLNNLFSMQKIKVSIYVTNKHEKEYVENNFTNYNSVINFTDNYDSYLINKFDIKLIGNLSDKYIYIVNYNFNKILTRLYEETHSVSNNFSILNTLEINMKG